MAKGGAFLRFVDAYTKVVWALIATLVLVGVILCAGTRMCKKGMICRGEVPAEVGK